VILNDPFAERLRPKLISNIPKRIPIGKKMLDFTITPRHVELHLAIVNAVRVWSNQSNTHFCDKASHFLLPFVRRIFPDAHIIKLYPKGVNYHEVIQFDNDKILDTQLKQFGVGDEIANKYIYPKVNYLRILQVEDG